jgi:hypothetical protein
MRKLLILALGLASVGPSRAQLFSHESVTGAGFGALAGGIIGHNSGHYGWEGAAIGAGAGFLLGSLIHEDRVRDRYYYSPSYMYQPMGYPTPTYAPAASTAPAVTQTTQPAPQAPPPAAPISNMSGANSLFGR